MYIHVRNKVGKGVARNIYKIPMPIFQYIMQLSNKLLPLNFNLCHLLFTILLIINTGNKSYFSIDLVLFF